MICKNCGTQAKGRYCSYCGTPLFDREHTDVALLNEFIPEPPPAKEQEEQTLPVLYTEPVEEKKSEEAAPKKQPKRRYPIHFFRILIPILLLFLPVGYLFFDIYIQLSDVLFSTGASGGTMLNELFAALGSVEHAFLTVPEIKTLLFGSDIALFRFVGAWDVLAGGSMGIALCFVLIPTALCALMGALLLLSFGRILRLRLFTDLLLVVAPAAGLSPLLGLLWLRLSALGGGFAAADAAAQGAFLSLESLLLCGIAICFMLPAVGSLRRAAATARGAKEYVPLPYRILGLRSFWFTRLLALIFLAAGVLLALSMLVLPILTTGRLTELATVKQSLIAGVKELYSAVVAIFSARGSEVDFSSMTAMLLDSIYLLQLPFMGLCVVGLIPALLYVLFSGRRHLSDHPHICRSMRKNGKRLRNLILSPYISFFVTHLCLVALWMFCSRLVMRVDFTNVSGMLELVYLIAGYVRTLSGTNTVYVLAALGGAVIWHTFGNLSRKLIQLSYEAHTN